MQKKLNNYCKIYCDAEKRVNYLIFIPPQKKAIIAILRSKFNDFEE